MIDSPYRLYRYFDDDQVPLYIGRSAHLATREQVHIDTSKWMDFAASSTIERCETAEALAEAERTAIRTERPIFNKQHNDTPEAKERLRAYLERHDRLDLLTPGPKMIERHDPTATQESQDPWPDPALSPEEKARKDAYERGEWIELWPGGPRKQKRTAANALNFSVF